MPNKMFQRLRRRMSSRLVDPDRHARRMLMAHEGSFTIEDLLVKPPHFIVREKIDEQLLIAHLQLACVTVNFDSQEPNECTARETKRELLLNIVSFFEVMNNGWTTSSALLQEFIAMFEKNLFRDFPSETVTYKPVGLYVEDQLSEVPLDPSWPHLQIVYEILVRFIVSPHADTNQIKRVIKKHFLKRLIQLFQSQDPRERDSLKTVMHRIYGRFMTFRTFLRSEFRNALYEFVYSESGEKQYGIVEILEIMGSVINGYSVPLKYEHKAFLTKVLIPLHTHTHLGMYHAQLAYCVVQYLEKDASLLSVVILGLLRFWPKQCSQKELLFLTELDDILACTEDSFGHIDMVQDELFSKIRDCIKSPHFQVCEKVLYFFDNHSFANYTQTRSKSILPILYPALVHNSKYHWNEVVSNLTYNIIQLFMEQDQETFEKISKEYANEYEQEQKEKDRRIKFYEHLKTLENEA